ncbi:hypothetical protein [Bacillus cereus]|uniref:hypothetical protein n=1 Tax=Bacillus cereus group TaxID=86661 RepID=UPI000994D248|nr:hypothetical protein [Bacillus cereus]OPA26141.1 hypothetical protein BHL53_06885 [Bacillus cereus]
MGAKLNQHITTQGVTAYQDDADPTVFHYYPANAQCKLGETLTEFKVTYWGIGPQYIAQIGDQYYDAVGAILAGRASVDVTEDQRTAITEAIREKYGVDPKISPLTLSTVKVKPVFAGITLKLEEGDKIFPESLQFGSSFAFLVGCPQNSLYANFVGNKTGTEEVANPSFAINVEAQAEFVGDPWKAHITADLSQVWSYVRRRFSVGVKVGWFRIGKAAFEKVIVDMHREKIISLDFIEGSLDTEQYGRQIFEMSKEMLSELNKENDFFKFEPVPDPSNPQESIYGWGVSLNAGYVEIDIKQSMKWEREISYTGRFKLSVPSSMSLAVGCNNETKQHFDDLGNSEEPCITQPKMKELQDRYKIELKKIENLKDKLMERYIAGDIDDAEYFKKYNIITGRTSVPTHEPDSDADAAPEVLNLVSGGRESLSLVPIDFLRYIN